MKRFEDISANSAPVREHNETNHSTEEVQSSIATRARKIGEKIVATAVVPVAAFGIAACGGEKTGAAGSGGEALYASSCAEAYKADSDARVYRVSREYGNTFEEIINNGAIKDTDGVTPVTQFTEVQQAQLIVGFDKMNAMYAPKIAPATYSGSLGDLHVAIIGDTTASSSREAQDGKLVGDACVMYGDEDHWKTIRNGGTKGGVYYDGDVDPYYLATNN